MDVEGRGYPDFYRNSSEELFIKTMMDSTVGVPAPTMEMLGFKNLGQNCRIDSEELFKSWLTNGESNGCHSTSAAHRPRQASRRISTELASLTNQNTIDATLRKANDNIICAESIPLAVDSLDNPNPTRIGTEKGMQASNLFLAKAWFHSSQPMTRSRSSELRRRYAAMQQSQTQIGIEAISQPMGNINTTEANGFNNIQSTYENNELTSFMSPSNSSSSTFINPQVGCPDKISSIIDMLKGTLERKRTSNIGEKEDSSFGYYSAEEALNQGQGIHVYETFQDGSTLGALQKIEESLMEGILSPTNPTAMVTTVSREPSQSESSVAPPIVSNGPIDVCDDRGISPLAPTICESSGNQRRAGRNQDFRENQKKGGLIRYGSVTSTGSVERGDPTKKRRVERSRKMAEAKEKSSTPAVPSDMQSILKRCENLEKEVRSLKLNLSFMNRKDSEQTKQIEELQKQNQELADEKERLLEEIERIIADTGDM